MSRGRNWSALRGNSVGRLRCPGATFASAAVVAAAASPVLFVERFTREKSWLVSVPYRSRQEQGQVVLAAAAALAASSIKQRSRSVSTHTQRDVSSPLVDWIARLVGRVAPQKTPAVSERAIPEEKADQDERGFCRPPPKWEIRLLRSAGQSIRGEI